MNNLAYFIAIIFGALGSAYAVATVIHLQDRTGVSMVFWFLIPRNWYDEYGGRYRSISLVLYTFSLLMLYLSGELMGLS